jgi:hypothetical protein
MPNRILKESICTSENIDQLSPWAEIAFYRLMVNCDDYGRMDARTKILKSRLFPLKDVKEINVQGWLNEMEEADLITLYHHDGKPYLQMKTWDRHQQVRAKRSKYPSADEIICNQMQSIDSKCPRNPIQSESLSESLSESESKAMIADAEAREIQNDQNRVLDAAEDAGFKMTNDVRAALIALYADSGLVKVLDGIKSCSEHGVANLAYLRAVLKGEPKKKKPKVVAQDFPQRNYEEVDSQMMDSLAREVAAFNAREVG